MKVRTDAIELLPKLIHHFDEPFADSSAIPTYYVSQMARQRVTVILSGDGGDELFAGYRSYQKKDEFQAIRAVPRGIRRMMLEPLARALPIETQGRNVLKFVANSPSDNSTETMGIYPYIKDDLLTPHLRNELQQHPVQLAASILEDVHFSNKLARMQYLDARLYLPGDILVKVDRMSMANSLETRAPLLDYRVIEFAARLPVELRIKDGITKYLLKKLLRRYVPEQIINKRKQGFAVPINGWFATTLSDFVRDVLLEKRARERSLFKAKTVEHVLNLHQAGRRDYSTWIWTLLNLELWFREYVDG
jgi:asparagine synthase (glutamine-hydrolysing)